MKDLAANERESTQIDRKRSDGFFCPQMTRILTDYFLWFPHAEIVKEFARMRRVRVWASQTPKPASRHAIGFLRPAEHYPARCR